MSKPKCKGCGTSCAFYKVCKCVLSLYRVHYQRNAIAETGVSVRRTAVATAACACASVARGRRANAGTAASVPRAAARKPRVKPGPLSRARSAVYAVSGMQIN